MSYEISKCWQRWLYDLNVHFISFIFFLPGIGISCSSYFFYHFDYHNNNNSANNDDEGFAARAANVKHVTQF